MKLKSNMEQLYSIFLQHQIICTDSRNCTKDALFFALKGENFNANAFALGALEKGCAYAVVDEKEYAIDNRFILVENTLETLQKLATYHRIKLETKIIGITGTNGKTTTKELIASVLSEKYNILFTQGNLNNHIGVPLTLLKLEPQHQLAVIEMGANHPGEIKALAEIARPDVGIITNVGKAHLEGFGSFEGVMSTKAELYDYISEKGRAIFINIDNDFLISMATKSGFNLNEKKVIPYCFKSLEKKCKIRAEITSCSPFLKMKCIVEESNFRVNTKLVGAYNAENVLAAVTIGSFFDLDNSEIKKGIEKYVPKNNRSQLTITEKNKLIVDAYNANPTSLNAAILNFAQIKLKRKSLILGDMLELGEQSAWEHQNMVDLLQQNNFKQVYLVGKDFMKTKNPYLCFETVSELKDFLLTKPIRGHHILVKGSRGIKLENVLELL